MKTHQPILTTSLTAAADTDPNLFIDFSGAVCGTQGMKPLGVSEVKTLSGEQLGVICQGIAVVLSGGAITKGVAVITNNAGKAIAASALACATTTTTDGTVTVPSGATPVTSDAAQPTLVVDLASDSTSTLSGAVPPDEIVGYALDAASGAGEYIRVLLGA